MLYLANPCGDAVIAAMEAGHLGLIDQPDQRKRPTCDAVRAAGVTWCADNGAFARTFDETRWWRFLTANASDAATCLFAVAPDVVGDAAATLERSLPWLPKIRALGYPAAFVAQNGLEDLTVPWEDFDCLFIGGTVECPDHGPRLDAIKTGRGGHQKFFCPVCHVQIYEWKLGPAARELCQQAKARDKWVHVGRVNSAKRFAYAEMPYAQGGMGADSADGTYLVAGPDKNLPNLLGWTQNLFGGVA